MSLDATAREANFRDSIKKFFVDTFKRGEKIPLSFDTGLGKPDLKLKAMDKWMSYNWGTLSLGKMSTAFGDVYVCTRRDAEGFKLAQLRDTVVGHLIDTDQTDGMKRIPFYRSYSDQAWDLIGGILVQEIIESAEMKGPDQSKYKILSLKLRFASKV